MTSKPYRRQQHTYLHQQCYRAAHPQPFVKTVKSSAYFSRYQVKYRRRREGRTDYYARKRLVSQAKNKYNAPKYRLVVRFSNRYITCQIVHAKIAGDYVLTQASSKELPRYGVKTGLANWTAAYATGLLVARRALTILGLADKYEGVTEPDGEMAEVESLGDDEPRPFKCFLDVGLKRTSTGSRVFGALKGASDGGIFIPHSEKRFPGYDPEAKELDAELLRSYIYGGHVAEYMESLEEEDDERFKKQFSTALEQEVGSEDLEDMWTEAFEKIREDPSFTASDKSKDWAAESKKYKATKLTYEQRKAKIADKIAAFKAGAEL
jgi:large subunit ribosomal protein L5e